MNTRRWPLAVPVMLVAMWMMFSSSAAHAQVLQNVPNDAVLVVKIRNLQDVSTKVAALAQQLGIAGMNPAMADPLAAVQAQSGVQNGLDKNGDLAIFVPSSALDHPDAEKKPVVFLWPVTDYKAFVGNFADAKEEGGITTFTMGNEPNPQYAANWGQYAAVSMNKEMVAQKPAQGLTVEGLAAKELDTKDLTVFFNVAPARAKLLPKLKEERPNIIAKMKEEMEGDEAKKKYVPLAEVVINSGLDLVEQLLNETNAATYGVSLNNDGINTTTLAEFDPKSKLGQRAAQFKGSNDTLLSGLPEGKYLFFGGCAIDPKALSGLVSELVAPAEGELGKLGDESKPILQYIDSLKKMIAATESSRFAMPAPSGPLGQEAIIQQINIARGDAAAISAAQKQMFDVQEQITAMFGGGKVQAKTTITPKAKTVGGVALDQFTSAINAAEQGPEAAQMQQMMAIMYGPNGLSGYFGQVDPKTAITAVGVSDEVLEKAVTAAKADTDVLGKLPGVTAVAKQLPPSRFAAFYVPLDTIIGTGLTYAQQFGFGVQVQLPQDLPPVGLTIGSEGSAIRADSHVPVQLVQSIVAAGMQAFMQMQGGKQPGGPGGL
jgi:hypothetical protein